MKYMPFLCLCIGIGLFLPSDLSAQYYSPHTRRLETYRDLPEVMIKELRPSIASDLTYLKYVAADTFLLEACVAGFMQPRDTLLKITKTLYPGSQELVLSLFGLENGWYQVSFFCKNRKVGICWLQISR